MSRTMGLSTIAAVIAGLVAGASGASARSLAHRDATDAGATPAAEIVSTSIILKVKHPQVLERFVELTQVPRQPAFHRFLSVREFTALFAPSAGEIATITQYLNRFGITVTDVMADRLVIHASGTVDAFEQAFSVDMHDFVAPNGHRFRRPMHGPHIPLLLRDLVATIGGFNTESIFRSNRKQAPASAIAPAKAVLPKPGALATGVRGSYTVGDFANQYNVSPLYAAGLDGRGRTLGIVTLANFLPADAQAYWNMVGLTVDPDRITQVHVDGGGELGAQADSAETSLDVEQAGGVAPGAKMVVYDAPDTVQGLLDGFYQAISDDRVDSLSCSWGTAEPFFFAPLNAGEDAVGDLTAFHQAFLEAAAQGISVFSASLDHGAFDLAGFDPTISRALSVDYPSSDPAVTAAGGTTLPFTLLGGPGTPDLVVAHEQVWGWDYLDAFFAEVFGDPDFSDIDFPIGTGGGVSVVFDVPWYQKRTSGIQVSEPDQHIIQTLPGAGPQHLMDLPAGFAGRNVPDISANADPETGYLVVSSSDGGLLTSFGGTSFVAPQLNGVSALISQQTGGRLGLWNPMLYRYQREITGSASPIVDITGGTNWFYAGVPGYEPGAGLGVLNVANLAAAIARDAR